MQSARAWCSRNEISFVCAGLIFFSAVTWVWAAMASRTHPLLLGTAALAYTLGLRHAVDADHIAAIDNATRKLMRNGQRPVAVGLFFALGHSSVVILATLFIMASAFAMKGQLLNLGMLGGAFGASISATFLLAIAAANLPILVAALDNFKRARQGHPPVAEDRDAALTNCGPLARLLGPIFKLLDKSWHMFPIGVLFGLGFDTAAEIGVLGLSATAATQGLSPWSILLFPALFTAGMTLVDTADGLLMLGVYGWGTAKPVRRLYYNVAVTSVSIVVALFVGGVEALGVIGRQLELDRGFWGVIATLNADFGALGCLVIGIFVGGWSLAAVIYIANGYDRVGLQDKTL